MTQANTEIAGEAKLLYLQFDTCGKVVRIGVSSANVCELCRRACVRISWPTKRRVCQHIPLTSTLNNSAHPTLSRTTLGARIAAWTWCLYTARECTALRVLAICSYSGVGPQLTPARSGIPLRHFVRLSFSSQILYTAVYIRIAITSVDAVGPLVCHHQLRRVRFRSFAASYCTEYLRRSSTTASTKQQRVKSSEPWTQIAAKGRAGGSIRACNWEDT